MSQSLNILVLATKSPWPACDGGRQVLATTIAALVSRGHRLTLVFPAQGSDLPCPHSGCRVIAVPVARRSRLAAAIAAQVRLRPLTLYRHDFPEMAAAVAELLGKDRYDLVHAEQVQALAAAAPAFLRDLPVVLRAQNLESELWRGLARRRWWLFPLLALEARRLAAAEGDAVRRVAATVALTFRDAAGLAALGHGGRVVEIAAPAPAELPAGEPLPGEKSLVLFGGGAWPPNGDGAEFFLRQIWPRIAADFPRVQVHVFGDPKARGERVFGHPAPADSRAAFARGAILLAPLFVGSGVRMKILEAWARGLPVIATPVAARGLQVRPGEELEIATDAASFAAAIGKLSQPEAAARAVAAGRRLLREHHDPEQIAIQIEELYQEIAVP